MSFKFVHEIVSLPVLTSQSLLAIKALSLSTVGTYLAVDTQGKLVKVDLAQHSVETILALPEEIWTEVTEIRTVTITGQDPHSGEPFKKEEERTVELGVALNIHLSSDELLVAVVNDGGRHGAVIDLDSRKIIMHLDCGWTRYWTTSFPAAFFDLDGRTLLAHGTAWNRLDVSDPLSGIVLTQRESPQRQKGDSHPPLHYLDYYHSGLSVSPDNEWITDWGWVWHPFGQIHAWNLRRWVEDNVWESEDGASKVIFCTRDDWDQPSFWVGNRTFGVWGHGQSLIPAVTFYDVETGEEIRWFPGPEGKLVFDGFLYSFSRRSGKGMSIWDIESGEQLFHDPNFCPTLYHQGTKDFITLLSDGNYRISHLEIQ